MKLLPKKFKNFIEKEVGFEKGATIVNEMNEGLNLQFHF